ncbi:hypothetical protein [Micromonospora parathelypteridis]|uniref:Uncharacterized protein n=1 Tax=Micromonospora parathelypteridis TaxID=1839617 RepID=A0A840W7L2_9ACTN|nr:hypothetical protein [Micromonospora parathelypteridis]GGO21872.1 hypothetical protein GCM10011576_40620 [Micromonospora parathelypteridis]
MRKPAKTAAVLFGLGVGTAVGPSLGPAALWSGVALATLGVALSLVGTTESDLIGDGLVDRDEKTEQAGAGTAAKTTERWRDRERPTLSGLSTRVEQILRLAEEQAADHRAEARLEAERIVASARREAELILHRTNEQGAGHRPGSVSDTAHPNAAT